MTGVSLGFDLEPLSISLENILPSRKMPIGVAISKKFKQICSSIEEIGLIEPLSVTPVIPESAKHMLLDGHIRLVALHQLGYEKAPCLLAIDDEGYTYNNRINRISTIQEHLMIRRAVDRGVSMDRLAKALSIDVRAITQKIMLLDGVCMEAAEILKDRQFSPGITRALRKMKPTRQVECVELMISANNLTVAYSDALLAATPSHLMAESKTPKKLNGVSQEQIARMEREMANLQGQYKLIEQNYGQDVLNLVLVRGYLTKLLENKSVARYIQQRQPDVMLELERIIQISALEQ